LRYVGRWAAPTQQFGGLGMGSVRADHGKKGKYQQGCYNGIMVPWSFEKIAKKALNGR
jgi:hypothetical protein